MTPGRWQIVDASRGAVVRAGHKPRLEGSSGWRFRLRIVLNPSMQMQGNLDPPQSKHGGESPDSRRALALRCYQQPLPGVCQRRGKLFCISSRIQTRIRLRFSIQLLRIRNDDGRRRQIRPRLKGPNAVACPSDCPTHACDRLGRAGLPRASAACILKPAWVVSTCRDPCTRPHWPN